MKKAEGYNISKKDFRQLSKWSENIYNTAVVIDYFVANQPEIEECYNLAPVNRYLRNEANLLNAFFTKKTWKFKSHLKGVLMPFKLCSKIKASEAEALC